MLHEADDTIEAAFGGSQALPAGDEFRGIGGAAADAQRAGAAGGTEPTRSTAGTASVGPGSLAQINLPNTHKNNDSKERFDGEQTCKGTFDGLLCTQLILYVAMEICIIILFFNVNSFKSTRFEKEDKISAIRKRKQLAERNKRLGVQPKEEGDEVEGINIQNAEIEEMENGKGRSVTFAKDLDGSPISDSEITNFMSSPSTDHERSPPVEGFLGGGGAAGYQDKQSKSPQQNKSQLLPQFHLPLSSPFSIFRTPKSSMNGMERNPLFETSQSPFSASIPTPPPICSPLQNEDNDMIVPISPFEVMRYGSNPTAYPSTYKSPYQRYDRTHQQQNHSIKIPIQQSDNVPKIIIDYYDEKGKIHTDDPIKRAIKSFIASKDH